MKTSEPRGNYNINENHSQRTRRAESPDGVVTALNTNLKDRIYNVIIVDESGSMEHLRNVTIDGVNETINTIKEIQSRYDDNQQHYLTLVTFRGAMHNDINTIIDAMPIPRVTSFMDYNPYGSTPLYDAVGETLTTLYDMIKGDDKATGSVTILTDGEENSSRKWNARDLKRLIESLKEEGWSFSYMGSAHNVKDVTDILSIDNAMEFSHDAGGASNTWQRERASKQAYFRRMHEEYRVQEAREEKLARMRRYNKEYYSDRVTSDGIRHLHPNEVFVFGSNVDGCHLGGTSAIALHRYGAQMGVGEGIQGRSYAIPTTSGFRYMAHAIERFCKYAQQHPNQKFLVTRIGCGEAGYKYSDVAPLFKEAIKLENVSLPMEFWAVLGLKML